MNPVHLRLREARRGAGYRTATEAARAFGWNENSYRSHEGGERGLRADRIATYADAFGVSPSWLAMGVGESKAAVGLVSISGNIVEAGLGVRIVRPILPTYARLPVSVPDRAECFWVSGPFLRPRYSVDDLLLCWGVGGWRGPLQIEGLLQLGDNDVTLRFGTFNSEDGRSGSLEVSGGELVTPVTPKVFIPVQIVVRAGMYELINRAR